MSVIKEFTPEGRTRDDIQVSGDSVGLIPFDIVTPPKLYYPHPRTVYYEKTFFILFLWSKLHCVTQALRARKPIKLSSISGDEFQVRLTLTTFPIGGSCKNAKAFNAADMVMSQYLT